MRFRGKHGVRKEHRRRQLKALPGSPRLLPGGAEVGLMGRTGAGRGTCCALGSPAGAAVAARPERGHRCGERAGRYRRPGSCSALLLQPRLSGSGAS